MSQIPHAVLSEYFQERMRGCRLRSAVFLTYEFDPAFFELQVLPVFLDAALSHVDVIRRVQLEDVLRSLPGEIAVYYDANGLRAGDGSAGLDVRRIPIRHTSGIFHPKNLFLLLESSEPDEEGRHAQTLLVASLSSNLTQSGWWENVEACHVEEIAEEDKSWLKTGLVAFLESLRRKASSEVRHQALREILAFLRTLTERVHKSGSGQLHTHFYAGAESLPDFLEESAGDLLRGTYLEVISPYFDDASSCKPLRELIDRFEPKEVRVFLPRSPAGEALCRPELYESVRQLPDVHWGQLPADILKLGRSDEAADRRVHAKVYRFFTQNPKRELCFVGSANLTSAAHQRGGNVETGFLVDSTPARRPEFWLTTDARRPTEFLVRSEDEGSATSAGTRLNLRYHWDTAVAEVFWDAAGESPALRIESRGIEIGAIPALSPRTWTALGVDVARRVADQLGETSLFLVQGEGDTPRLLLVQEEAMSHKPSLLLRLSATDILRYWSLLTADQRSAFLEARAPELSLAGPGADLVVRARLALETETLFERFAGFFHAFGCLDRAVRVALDADHEREVTYRLFGNKYDSLGNLLDRVIAEGEKGDDVDHYVIFLCAQQLCQELEKDYPDYWTAHGPDTTHLKQRFQNLKVIRQRLMDRKSDDLEEFLDWFDKWFLRRAMPVEPVEP